MPVKAVLIAQCSLTPSQSSVVSRLPREPSNLDVGRIGAMLGRYLARSLQPRRVIVFSLKCL